MVGHEFARSETDVRRSLDTHNRRPAVLDDLGRRPTGNVTDARPAHRRAVGGPATVAGTAANAPNAPTARGSGATRSTLLTTYNAMHNVYRASHSYQTISLQTLGALLPNITIEDGSGTSTNSGVVSLLTPTSDRVGARGT